MKCHISYRREEPDTINGEKLILTHYYTTFDIEEMDALEQGFRDQYGSGVIAEFDMPKARKNE